MNVRFTSVSFARKSARRLQQLLVRLMKAEQYGSEPIKTTQQCTVWLWIYGQQIFILHKEKKRRVPNQSSSGDYRGDSEGIQYFRSSSVNSVNVWTVVMLFIDVDPLQHKNIQT